MSQAMNMGQSEDSPFELTPITKLLLWMLSKRPDIGNLSVQDSLTTDYWLDLEPDELYANDLDPELVRLFDTDHLDSCWELKPFDKGTA
jgi:hypothetical protein